MSDPMKDFQPVPAEPEPDAPFLSRWFTYLFGSAVIGVIFAGVVLYQMSGGSNRHLARRNLEDVEGSNKRILLLTKIAGGLGFGVGMFFSLRYEFITRKQT